MIGTLLASLCLVLGAVTAAENIETPPPHLGSLLSDYLVQVHRVRGNANFLRMYLVSRSYTMHAHVLASLL